MRIVSICGSLHAGSKNLALLEATADAAPDGVDIVIDDHLRTLPLFNPDLETAGPPDAVMAWRQALADSDAVLIASPEYGHSLPGALKNGIDWVIGSIELNRKVAAITAAVAGPNRGLRGLRALRDTLQAVDADIVWDAPIVTGAEQRGQIDALMARLVEEVERRRDKDTAAI
jgi:chromate reductase